MKDELKNNVEERLIKLTDRFLDVGMKVADRGADFVDEAVSSHELVMSTESLSHLLKTIQTLISPWAIGQFHNEGKFLHFVSKNVGQYIKILKVAQTSNPVVAACRDEIARELSAIAIEVRTILNAKPVRKLWERKATEDEVNTYQAAIVSNVTPKLISRLLAFIDEEIKILEVVQRMGEPKNKQTQTQEVKNP